MNLESIIAYLASSGLVIAILKRITNKILKKLEEEKLKEETKQAAMQKGLQALLRNALHRTYEAHKEMGHASIEEKENFSNMYEQYHNLGLNGVMDGVKEEFLKLPNTPPEEV